MNTTALILAMLLLSGGISQAGDYFIYRDADGKTWLSNQDPRKKDDSPARQPDNIKIIKQFQWQDVATDGYVAGSTIVAPPPVTKAPK
jgi:hypothetical protein